MTLLDRLRQGWRRLFGVRPPPAAGLEPRVGKLLAVLHQAGLKPTAVELADMLWLAAHLSPAPARAEGSARLPEKPPSDKAKLAFPKTTQQNRRSQAPSRSAARKAELYPGAGGLGGARPARPFPAPAVPLLPAALALGRALCPLHRKVPSRRGQRLLHRPVSGDFRGV